MIDRKRRVKRLFLRYQLSIWKLVLLFQCFRSIASLPCKIVREIDTTSFQEFILSSGVFRRETASGFYPWSNVDSPRKRVAEGLCGWRHGNSSPMTKSAQSHRQMRSIPRCSKAVFYVFVFDYIHDSAIMQNRFFVVRGICYGVRDWVRISMRRGRA